MILEFIDGKGAKGQVKDQSLKRGDVISFFYDDIWWVKTHDNVLIVSMMIINYDIN